MKGNEIDNEMQQEADAELEIVYLSSQNASFMPLGEDFLSLEFGGKTYKRVTLSRAMPFSDPDNYIIVKDSDDKEIGIIKSIHDFNAQTVSIINKHLSMRYYCPKICEIVEVKDKFGFIYVTVNTDSGTKNFASQDLTKSIKRISGERYVIVDVEGNRFLIENLLSVKNYKKILMYIV